MNDQNSTAFATDLTQIGSKFSALVSQLSDQDNSQNPMQIDKLNALLDSMVDSVREKHQKDNAATIRELLRKLKGGYKPNEADLGLLAEFMIGDAKYYVEANRGAFEEGIKRLSTYNFSFATSTHPQEIICKIKALKMSLRELQWYLAEKERVENFRRAMGDGVDMMESKYLEEIIEFKLKSENH